MRFRLLRYSCSVILVQLFHHVAYVEKIASRVGPKLTFATDPRATFSGTSQMTGSSSYLVSTDAQFDGYLNTIKNAAFPAYPALRL